MPGLGIGVDTTSVGSCFAGLEQVSLVVAFVKIKAYTPLTLISMQRNFGQGSNYLGKAADHLKAT